MTACPDPDTLLDYVGDTLDAATRTTVETHIDDCEECRATVSILARAERRESQPVVAGEVTALAATELGPAPVATSSPIATGTTLGRYVLGETLGAGGMGVVYAARDPDLNREVAIKVLRPELARAHPDATKRIVREAQAMARIAHPNVVSVFDVGTVEERVFVAMERVSGTSLRGWLARTRRTQAEILEVFVAAGRGLVAAHDAGIVHRDFKPDNVLVGDDGRARVTDFGLAYDRDDADALDTAMAGTPAYMAPEQHAGGNVDPRTDQFSFAVALYEALHGQRPFAGTTRKAIARAIERGQIEPPPAGVRVSSSLRAIVVRALAARPGERYATLDEMLAALGRDRARRPRRIALGAFVALLVVGLAFVADVVTRDRTTAVARTAFAATRAQLDKTVSLRTDAFVATSDALYRLPAVEAVAQSRDEADFGFGDAADDRRRRRYVHDNLSSADWIALTRSRGDTFAIADYKGRLMFTSADAQVWDGVVADVSVLGAAYDARAPDTSVGVVDGADPNVVSSGLLGGRPRPGLFVLFARAKRVGPRTNAMFVQAVAAARLLDEVGAGGDTKLSLLASDGRAEGSVPPPVIDASSDQLDELVVDGSHWLAERTPLGGTVAQLVLARESDVGLAGLFPHARLAFAGLAAILAVLVAGGVVLGHRRDLSRR